jgi:MFS family permease
MAPQQSSLSEPLLSADDECLPSSTEGSSSTEQSEPVSRNVTITLIYTWFIFAGRSIWNQNVLATFAFLLRDGDPKAVGFMTAAMGLSQLLVSFPSGYLADKYRRDSMLKVASIIGVAAVTTTIIALHHSSYTYLVVALCVWGFFWGVANTSLSALFADSIRDGQRAHFFTTRSVLINLGNVTGPLVALIMFAALGDKWTIRACSTVMAVGQLICLPAVFLLCFLNDDAAVPENEETSRQAPLLGENQNVEENNPEASEEPRSNRNTGTHEDENYDARRLGYFFRCLPQERVIPVLIATADVTAGLASGMSIRFFAIFLYDNLHINPVNVQVLYIIAPLIQAALMKIAQILAQRFGRCQIAVVFKWTGIMLMFAMVTAYSRDLPVWSVCTLLVFRTAFMNSTSALTKSVLMDNVPKEERAKWSALESLNTFSWSGSAALGGILVDYRGIVWNFCITACLQFIATMPFLILSVFGKADRNAEQDDEEDG